MRSHYIWALLQVRQGIDPYDRFHKDPKFKDYSIEDYIRHQSAYTRRRLSLLAKHKHIELPKQQKQYENCRYTFHIYERKSRSTFNQRYGEDVNHRMRTLGHTLAICDILADIEIGCFLTEGTHFISPSEVNMRFPTATSKQRNPYAFSTTIHYNGETKTLDVEPDAIFGIEYTKGGQKSYHGCLLEANCGTESQMRTTLKLKSHLRELLTYKELSKGGYKKQWNLPSMLMLNVMHSGLRIRKSLIVNEHLSNGKGYGFALYRSLPKLGMTPPPFPTGELFTSPWQRANQEPFDISSV